MVHRPVGSRFGPSDLGAVRRYLRNMVERKDSDCLKTMDVYEDEPWLLYHVYNPLFKENHWYYFVPRKKRGRIVQGRGESEGGTWKSTGKKVDILDGNQKVVGYKRSLVFNKKVNGNPKPTNWLMTEFSLDKDGREFQDLVLVLIRYKKNKKGNLLGFNEAPRLDREYGEVPELEGEHVELDDYVNELEKTLHEEEDPQLEGEHVDLDDYVNELEKTLHEEEDPQLEGYVNAIERTLLVEEDTQEEQQNTSNLALPPLPSNLDFLMEIDDNNFLVESFDNNLITQNDFFMQSNDNNFLVESNENNLVTQNNFFMHSNENNILMHNNDSNVLMHNENNVFMHNNLNRN